MRNLLGNILDLARVKGAEYADIRVVHRQNEEIAVKNGKLDALTRDEDAGFGVRVLFRGAWGFACSSKVNQKEMAKTLNRAWKIARESSRAKGNGVHFSPALPATARYETPHALDPLHVPPEKKIALLLDCDTVLRRQKKVKISEAFLGAFVTEKTFASTEGSIIEQKNLE
jgi:TldD protein